MKTKTLTTVGVLVVALSLGTGVTAWAQEEQVAPAPQPVPVAAQPDDVRLLDIVKLVQAGLSESLIAESVRTTDRRYDLTTRDLIFLKDNRVPESVIAALLAVQAPTTPSPGRQVAGAEADAKQVVELEPEELVVEGLVMRTGWTRKNRPGTLVFLDDTVEWRDATDSSNNATIFPSGVKKVELTCRSAAGEPFCYELEVDIQRGDKFKFEDAQRDTGGNEAILALRDAWKEKYPRILITEKLKKR